MTNQPPDALIITRSDIRRVMDPADYLEAVELGFRAEAMGKAAAPMPIEISVSRGAFHAKGASISLGRDFVSVKVNGNFPDNPAKHCLPTIQGAILLADGGTGTLLAIIDSIEVTLRRTAAASALAARMLARPLSSSLLVCGCGEQGRAHAEALRSVLPLTRFLLWDRNPVAARALAAEVGGEAVADLATAARSADAIVTCTTSHEPYLTADMVAPGTFIAAVGADKPDKSEIAPELMAAAAVVTDVTAQCAAMGDLHHAIAAGAMTKSDVRAQLGELLAGEKPGRAATDEIVIFDSTGTGLQDVAAGAAIYERCVEAGLALRVALSA
jgi:ornithine cyclodeaminase/alanine dehydrogenase-like protein (mu-crystallin family)